jgi:hypothetical protein
MARFAVALPHYLLDTSFSLTPDPLITHNDESPLGAFRTHKFRRRDIIRRIRVVESDDSFRSVPPSILMTASNFARAFSGSVPPDC